MTTHYSNRIITLAERSEMLSNDVSNDELKTLLGGVDTKGVPAIDRERIKALIVKLESPDEWPFGWPIRTEKEFDRTLAVEDLKEELMRREQNVAGNAEHVGRYVAALNNFNSDYTRNNFLPYLKEAIREDKNPIAERTQTLKHFSPETLRAINCEFAMQVANVAVGDLNCPAQPHISSGSSYGMPLPGQML